jgi:hypothetical protein
VNSFGQDHKVLEEEQATARGRRYGLKGRDGFGALSSSGSFAALRMTAGTNNGKNNNGKNNNGKNNNGRTNHGRNKPRQEQTTAGNKQRQEQTTAGKTTQEQTTARTNNSKKNKRRNCNCWRENV